VSSWLHLPGPSLFSFWNIPLPESIKLKPLMSEITIWEAANINIVQVALQRLHSWCYILRINNIRCPLQLGTIIGINRPIVLMGPSKLSDWLIRSRWYPLEQLLDKQILFQYMLQSIESIRYELQITISILIPTGLYISNHVSISIYQCKKVAGW